MDSAEGPGAEIGKIVAVSGSQVTGRLLTHPSNGPVAVEFGELVKMRTPSSEVFGVVVGFWIEAGQESNPSRRR